MAKKTDARRGREEAGGARRTGGEVATKPSAAAAAKGEPAQMATDASPRQASASRGCSVSTRRHVRGRLAKQFGFKNPHQVPRITKIVLNVGLGEGAKNPRLVDAAAEELAIITGQKAVITKAKKAIANFGLRAGLPVGCAVTLRGARMYEFLDRFVHLTVPRIRDFRGLAEQELRRTRELHVRYQGTDHVPRDRLRQDRERARDGHHAGDQCGSRRSGHGAAARVRLAIQG